MAEQLLCLGEIGVQLVLNFWSSSIAAVCKGPAQEIANILFLDLRYICAQSPQAQISFGIGDIFKTAVEESLAFLSRVWRVVCRLCKTGLKAAIDEEIVHQLGQQGDNGERWRQEDIKERGILEAENTNPDEDEFRAGGIQHRDVTILRRRRRPAATIFQECTRMFGRIDICVFATICCCRIVEVNLIVG